jgi:hypothetical protein
MADKLTPQQQAQLDMLETLPPRFELAHRLIAEIESLRADESQIRRLCRLLDTGKAAANSVGQTALADTMGMMSTIARRGGDRRMKVRGLRDGLVSLKINYEGAVRAIRVQARLEPLAPPSASAPAGGPPAGRKSGPPSR